MVQIDSQLDSNLTKGTQRLEQTQDTETDVGLNSQEELEAIASAFLSKLYQKQQQIMALQHNVDDVLSPLETNLHHSFVNNAKAINCDEMMWIDNNIDNSRNQSKISANLSALKHDHPLIASAVDNMATRPNNNGLCANDAILIASLPPTKQPSLTQCAQWFCDEKKPTCLPYGYYYDDGKVLAQTQIPSNFSDFELHSTLNHVEDWALDDEIEPAGANYYNDDISNYRYTSSDEYNMEDVFQVDKADLKTGPTLAQLNSNLTNDVWDSLDLDDLLASAQSDNKKVVLKSKYGSMNNGMRTASTNNTPSYSMELEYDAKLQENIDYLTSILYNNTKGGYINPVQSNPVPHPAPIKCLATSSPTNDQTTIQEPYSAENVEVVIPQQNNTMLSNLLNAQTVNTVDCKPQIEQTSTPIKHTPIIEIKSLNRVRNNSMSTEYSVSSHDEGFASQQEESDNDDDENSSDDESFYGDYDASDLLGASTSDDANNKWSLNMGRSRKGGERRYFWQYNVQSKGPKGTRIAAVEESNDPHVLKEISDPVFSPDCQIEGVKHSGKARRGDGNDLTPNPKKLLMIGLELKKLSKIINELTPVAEVPITSRSKSRKEKNKLASRACRLKKKAQHEANKIKLYGLQQEHKRMMSLLTEIKKHVKKYMDGSPTELPASLAIEKLIKQKGPSTNVAGKTSEFVNHILDNVAAGINNGGLDKI